MYSVLAIALVVITSTRAIKWNKNNSAMDCDFMGNDLTYVRCYADECRRECSKTPGCTHYTWTRSFDIYKPTIGTCYMKKNFVLKTDAVSKWFSECGIMSASFKGYLTSNWDCCKPSCSWTGKSSVSKPVASCSYDGETVLNNSNIESGCSDGDAFPCNHYQPLEFTDDLSLGFATARLPGKTQADLCCRCFELTFTSKPIVGKKMYIQVINTDEDSTEQENNFELYVPGTGDSNSSGCPAQWEENKDAAGWKDNLNFGVPQREMYCYIFPRQLIEGCVWRFQWLQNVDKPTFNFTESPCHPDLISKSGCVRQ